MNRCMKCGGETVYYDKVKRVRRGKYGKKEWIYIFRVKCCECGRICRSLPIDILPFKHYDKRIVEGVIEGLISPATRGYEDYPSEQTMHRWAKEYAKNTSIFMEN